MSMRLFMLAAVLFPLHAADAQGRRGDQAEAFAARREGALRPLRDLESTIVPQMKRRGAEYIGAEYDGITGRYRLKFIRGGSVIWVDVDGRNGNILARAGD